MELMRLSTLFCCFLLSCSALCSASESKIYLGAAAGASSYDSIGVLFDELGGSVDFYPDTRNSDIAYQFQLGWRASDYLAIEVAYTDFGDAEGEYRWADDVNGHSVLVAHDYSANLSSTNLALKGMLPLGKSRAFSLFAKLGYAKWSADVGWDEALYFDDLVDSRTQGAMDLDGEDLMYSFGAEYELNRNFVVFGEYFTQLSEVEDGAGNTYDWLEASAVMVGVRWQFSTRVFNRNGPESQYGNRKITACEDPYAENSGIICDR